MLIFCLDLSMCWRWRLKNISWLSTDYVTLHYKRYTCSYIKYVIISKLNLLGLLGTQYRRPDEIRTVEPKWTVPLKPKLSNVDDPKTVHLNVNQPLSFSILLISPTASVVQWSELLATDPEVRAWFRHYQIFWEKVGLERGPLSLVSTTEELLGKKVAAPV
jgi:hypothetical protein